MQIRAAVPEDEPGLRILCAITTAELRKTYRPTPQAVASKNQMSLARLVAVENGTPIGTAEFKVADSRAHVIGLAVHPDWRRRGIARRLLEAIVNTGRSAGATKLSLYSIVQTGNLEIFEKLGFCVVHESAAENLIGDQPLTEAYLERKID